MAYLLLLLLAWQPLFWSAMALYHKIKGDTFDTADYMINMKEWFNTLWDLVKPKKVTL